MTQRLNVGLIGAGFMGKAHSLGYAAMPMFFWPAPAIPYRKTIADVTEELAAEAALRFGFESSTGDWRRIIDDPAIDVVDIATPNDQHAEMAVAAAEAGKHVLCEKPLAMDAAEAEAMASAAERAGRLLMEALMYRFHPRLRAQVAGLRSRPRHVSAWFGFRVEDPSNYRLRPELGGGALMDVGVYGLSACRWILGEPEEVAAVAHLGPTGVDLTSGVSMRFAEGATGYVWASLAAPEQQALEVQLSDLTLRIEQPFTAWRDPDDPYQVMVEAFAAAALEGGPAPLAPAESIANLRLIDRVRVASARTVGQAP